MSGLKGRIARIEEALGGPRFRGRLVVIAPSPHPLGDEVPAPGSIVHEPHCYLTVDDMPCTYLYVAFTYGPGDPDYEPATALSWRQREFLRPDDRVILGDAWDGIGADGQPWLGLSRGDNDDAPTWREIQAGLADPERN